MHSVDPGWWWTTRTGICAGPFSTKALAEAHQHEHGFFHEDGIVFATLELEDLAQWWPKCGPCAFSGHPDKRHRVWGAIIERHRAGESTESLAEDFGVPEEAVEAVLWVLPYAEAPATLDASTRLGRDQALALHLVDAIYQDCIFFLAESDIGAHFALDLKLLLKRMLETGYPFAGLWALYDRYQPWTSPEVEGVVSVDSRWDWDEHSLLSMAVDLGLVGRCQLELDDGAPDPLPVQTCLRLGRKVLRAHEALQLLPRHIAEDLDTVLDRLEKRREAKRG